jgi:DNA repair protein RecO (recombination protein O)
LLALAADAMPAPADLADLRLALRELIAHHLGGRPLAAWSLVSELAQLRAPERTRSD